MTFKHKQDPSPITRLPLLALRDMVVFPRMVVPLLVGRPGSAAAVDESLASGRELFLCAQIDADTEEPGRDDLHKVGVAASILQTLRMTDGTMKVVVEGLWRGKVAHLHEREAFLEASVRRMEPTKPQEKRGMALMRTALKQFEEHVRLSQRIAPEIALSLRNIAEPDVLSELICAYLAVRFDERQELLETEDTAKQLEIIAALLMRENELLNIEHKVRDRVRDQMDRNQREYYLHEQIKAIQQELGNREEAADEHTELDEMIEKARMSKEAKQKAVRELARYGRMPPMSPEGAVIRTYIEWLCDVPWRKRTRDAIDLERAHKVLDEDHYGLKKVKERILEFLAVRKLSKSAKGPILCLAGPPGVGKTSLGQSIARAMGRKFVRMSLGGVRDEAEIRGHRRTYVGSMPGRILQNMKRVGVKNPVFMLDEIDKMGQDFRGDPASALLEVLDPEQNKSFNDHYLEVDFDLREVFFITTANNEFDIPHALHDRMEIVRLSGYTAFEKEHIARLFLVPKQSKESGLTDRDLRFTKDGLYIIIERYTREAGVRELERCIAKTCRKVARGVVERKTGGKAGECTVAGKDNLGDLLGPFEYSELCADAEAQVGVAMGMAWTPSGGDVLTVETSTMNGKGKLTLTGQLGDVMQESAKAAYTYLRAHADELKVPADFHKDTDMHVHVPEGAIQKDGPSAGIPMAVSMLSALTGRPPKAGLSMTGEITLRGRVLPVGGVKEKVLAAHRAGIRTIIMPKENEKDLVEIPKEVKDDVTFQLVENISEVFESVFESAPKAR